MKQKKEERRKFYRATEASDILSVSLPTLRKWAAEGRISCFMTPGKRYRYDVDAFLGLATAATDAVHKRKAAQPKPAKPAKAKEPELPFMAEAEASNQKEAVA